MYDEVFEKKYQGIISNSLDKLGFILDDVEVLDPIIKENQIRRFKDKWYHVFINGLDSEDIILSNEFRLECEYLFNRMNDKNKIEKRLLELLVKTKLEHQSLK
jgi:hypothetical protein